MAGRAATVEDGRGFGGKLRAMVISFILRPQGLQDPGCHHQQHHGDERERSCGMANTSPGADASHKARPTFNGHCSRTRPSSCVRVTRKKKMARRYRFSRPNSLPDPVTRGHKSGPYTFVVIGVKLTASRTDPASSINVLPASFRYGTKTKRPRDNVSEPNSCRADEQPERKIRAHQIINMRLIYKTGANVNSWKKEKETAKTRARSALGADSRPIMEFCHSVLREAHRSSSSSSDRGQSSRKRRLSARSARSLPPVWQRAQ